MLENVYGLNRYEFRDMSLIEMVMNENDVYDHRVVVFPPLQRADVNPTDSFTGVIKVTPGSLLISLCGYSSQDAGFSLSVFDKSANYYMVEGEYDWWKNQCGEITGVQGGGQRFFTEPVPILGSGQLQLTVTNLDKDNVNRIQVALQFAERSKRGG